jgi:hypothetical protein
MRRVLGVVALCALPVSVLSLSLAGTASAASPATAGVVCNKISGNFETGTTGKLSKCTDTANTGGSGTFPISALSSGSGNITWASGHGTTALTNVTPTSVTPDTCPNDAAGNQESEFTVTADIAGGTGAAKKSIKKGWTLTSTVCVDLAGTGAFKVLPGTTVQIGAGL